MPPARKPKTKMIGVRVTEAEHRRLHEIAEQRGLSLTELLLTPINRKSRGSGGLQAVRDELEDLRARVEALERRTGKRG